MFLTGVLVRGETARRVKALKLTNFLTAPLLATALIAPLGVQQASAASIPAVTAAPAALQAKVRVVSISARSVTLDVFSTGALAEPGANAAIGHRSVFKTSGATISGEPWSSNWRSIRKNTLLDITATVTAKAAVCAPDPARLGTSFCASLGSVYALTKYADLKLVTAAPASGSCVTGSYYRVPLVGPVKSGMRLRAELCFYPTVTGPVAIGYLNDYRGLHADNNELLVEAGKDLYFSVPVAPGSMLETKIGSLPAPGIKLRFAISYDLVYDGKDATTSKYSTVTLSHR